MTLRDRCKEMYQKMQRDAMMRQGSPVEDLMAFVMSENGRAAAADVLEDMKPVVLYFRSDQDREGFLAVVHEAKPNMMTKKMP